MTKTVEASGPNEVRIDFEVDSSRGAPVVVQVIDVPGADGDIEVTGPAADWETAESAVKFERILAPTETVFASYRVGCDDPKDVGPMLDPPEVVVERADEGAIEGDDAPAETSGAETGEPGSKEETTGSARELELDAPRPLERGDPDGPFDMPGDDVTFTEVVTSPMEASRDPGPSTDGNSGSGTDGNSGSGTDGNSGSGTDGNSGSGTDGNSGSGTDGNSGSGTDGNSGSGTDGNSGSGTDGNSGSGTDGNSGSGTDGNSGSGTDGNSGSGTDGNSGSGTDGNSGSGASDERTGKGTEHGTLEQTPRSGGPTGSESPSDPALAHDNATPPGDGESAAIAGNPAGREPQSDVATGIRSPPASLDVRVRHLQARFQDLAAYIDAMQELVDEYESDEGFFAEIDDRFSELSGKTSDLQRSQEGLSERLTDLSGEITALREELADHREATDEELSRLNRTIETIESDRRSMAEDVEELLEFRDSLRRVLSPESSPDSDGDP